MLLATPKPAGPSTGPAQASARGIHGGGGREGGLAFPPVRHPRAEEEEGGPEPHSRMHDVHAAETLEEGVREISEELL